MSLVEGRLADSCSVQVPGESGLVRLDVREPRPPVGQARRRAERSGHDVLPFGSDAPAAVAFRTGRTQLAPLHDGEDGADRRRLHRAGRAPDRQRRGHRRHDLRRRAGPALRGGRRLAGHRGGEPGRCRPVQCHTVPAGACRGGRAAARRAPRLAARGRGPLARRRVPGRGRRHLRRRRLVRRLRARRRHGLLQRGRRHGQGRPGRRPDGPGAQRHPRLRGLRPVTDRGALVAGPPLRHAHRGQGGHRRRRHDHPVDGTGRPEQRRPPSAAGGARRRQRDLLPHATHAAHRGRVERRAPTARRGRARPRRLTDHVLRRPDRAPGRGDHARHGATGQHGNGRCARRLAGPPRGHVRIHAERRRAHRRRRGALPQLHRCSPRSA